MILLDANYILRFLIKDNENMFEISKKSIINNDCFILNEVLAEVVFVLLKVYKVKKIEITSILVEFLEFDNIFMDTKDEMIKALYLFESKNIDFVDSILCVKSKKYKVKTFDKKLNKCFENIN